MLAKSALTVLPTPLLMVPEIPICNLLVCLWTCRWPPGPWVATAAASASIPRADMDKAVPVSSYDAAVAAGNKRSHAVRICSMFATAAVANSSKVSHFCYRSGRKRHAKGSRLHKRHISQTHLGLTLHYWKQLLVLSALLLSQMVLVPSAARCVDSL